MHVPGTAAQTRMGSVARIRLDPRKSVRPFKGIICDDISEFEVLHASHAVGLSQVRSPLPDTTIGSSLAINAAAKLFSSRAGRGRDHLVPWDWPPTMNIYPAGSPAASVAPATPVRSPRPHPFPTTVHKCDYQRHDRPHAEWPGRRPRTCT